MANLTLIYGTTLLPLKISFTLFHLAYVWGMQSEICLEASNFPQPFQELWFQTPPSPQNPVSFFWGQSTALCLARHTADFFCQLITALEKYLMSVVPNSWEENQVGIFCCCFFLIWCECGISLIGKFTSEREQNMAIIGMQKDM